jgi:uncharacterized membrane protein YgdD (TMEM256/DUF423 family)
VTYKKILLAASVLGGLAVIFGAFGAHALKNIVTERGLQVYQTGISYHFYHTLALLGLAAWAKNDIDPSVWLGRAASCFLIGILLFSGSLYLITLKEVLGLDNWMFLIGPATPVGGLFFIMGWGCLSASILAKTK